MPRPNAWSAPTPAGPWPTPRPRRSFGRRPAAPVPWEMTGDPLGFCHGFTMNLTKNAHIGLADLSWFYHGFDSGFNIGAIEFGRNFQQMCSIGIYWMILKERLMVENTCVSVFFYADIWWFQVELSLNQSNRYSGIVGEWPPRRGLEWLKHVLLMGM